MPRLGLPRLLMGSGMGRLSTLAATAAFVALLWAPAAPAASTAPAAIGDTVGASPAAVRAYWTKARMQSALPGSLLSPGGAALAPRVAAAPKRGAGVHKAVTHLRRYPNRTHGKVFFSIPLPNPDAGNYQCSGTAVDAPSRSLVITAGHCGYERQVVGTGNTITHWAFIPAYHAGRKPFGEWPAARLDAPSGWTSTYDALSEGDSRVDVSAATVAPLHGKKLEDVVGARKIRFDQARQQDYKAIGYPAESPPAAFDGGHEFSCESPYQGPDNSVGNPATISISCDMTGGSSGGGWIIGHRYLVSVTSYGYSNQPNVLYGPYFGDAIRSFYASVKNG